MSTDQKGLAAALERRDAAIELADKAYKQELKEMSSEALTENAIEATRNACIKAVAVELAKMKVLGATAYQRIQFMRNSGLASEFHNHADGYAAALVANKLIKKAGK